MFHVKPFTQLLPDPEFFKQPINNPKSALCNLPDCATAEGQRHEVEKVHHKEGSGAVKRARINGSHKFNETK